MSFRTLVALLCLSTVVFAQVPLSPQPSPSLPETFVPQKLPVVVEKPIAPNAVAPDDRKKNGIRLVVSLPENDHVELGSEIPSRSIASTYAEGMDSQPAVPIVFPRTASRVTDNHNLVPLPRPLPGETDINGGVLSRIDRLTRELTRKQQQLNELEAEITQLSLDIAAAEPPQVLVKIVIYDIAGSAFGALVDLFAAGSNSNRKPVCKSVVQTSGLKQLLQTLADTGQLAIVSRPKLMTVVGRSASISIDSHELSFGSTIVPQIENEQWVLDTTWHVKRRDVVTNVSATAQFANGESHVFHIGIDGNDYIAVLKPEIVETNHTVTPVSFTTPLLPIPDFAPNGETARGEVRNVDLNLKKHAGTLLK